MSDTSQGEGWWVASDGKWYAAEQHPEYVSPETRALLDTPVKAANPSRRTATTMGISAIDEGAVTPPAEPHPGPSFAPARATTEISVVDVSPDPNYDLPETGHPESKNRKLILGLGALVLVAGLGFLTFRFLGASAAGGADSPEAAISQLIASVNERDAVGFVDVFDPDEIDAWFGSFAPAFSEFGNVDDRGESTNEISEAYASVFKSFDYNITGPGGETITYQVEPLDDDGRIKRVRVDGLDFELTVDDVDTAVIFGFGDNPTGLDIREIDGTSGEVRDERGGLATRLFVPGEAAVNEFAPDGHIDLVTVKKNGKWFVSLGYTFLELARTQGEFDRYPNPDFGRAFDLVEDKTGGAESPEAVVRQLFKAIETLSYETIIELTDPYATPYLHDYQPLIDSEVDERDRQAAVQDAGLRFDELELGVSEWEGRTLVTTTDISAAANGGTFNIDTTTWCVTLEDEFDREQVCLEDGVTELLREIDSEIDPRDFIPEETGFVVIERNDRWYLDALGTMGYYADQIAEIGLALTDELDGNLATEVGDFFVAEGPIARANMPAVRQAESGSVGIAVDLSDYPTVGDQFSDYHVAVARVITNEPGSFVSYANVPLTGEDWVVVYDSTESDVEIPAIAASTNGSLDVELFEVQITEVGPDGFTGQLGGQGRPQVFTFSEATHGLDITVDGATAETIYGYESNGVVLNRNRGGFSIGGGPFTVINGAPGATFTIAVQSFEEPEPELEPDPTPEPTPEPERDPVSGLDDPIVVAFAGLVEPEGYDLAEVQLGGFFDGCGGPDDPDVSSYVYEELSGALLVLTPYPNVDRAEQAFESLVNVNSPCAAFAEVEVNDVVSLGANDIRIEWQFTDDPASVTYEHYRLVGETVVVATNGSLIDIEDQLNILGAW